ncbi:YeeE/YedE family protein [uncultured Zoogloea sp.]|uniref:YeeE/YedE family protein n=1 Tax=uncultured Zoogloea sp. TaxID=160237 RepID=UPI0026367385|nr:YeeE/YedE family protein [uncultured Zoogloea sp.]
MMEPTTILLLAVLGLAVVFGAAAQFSRVCVPGGLGDWMFRGEHGRLAAYFIAIGVAVIGTGLLQALAGIDLNDTKPPYRSPEFAWGRYAIGGFLFGVGMVLARGCPVRNLVKLGQGNLQSLPVLVVMAATAYAMTRTSLYADWFLPWVGGLSLNLTQFGIARQDLASLFGGGAGLAVVLALIVGIAFLALSASTLSRSTERRGAIWLGGGLIGATVAAAYWLTGGPLGQKAVEAAEMMDAPPEGLGVQSFTFAAPLGDVVHYLGNPAATSTITFGVVAVAGVLIGALLSAVVRREFAVQRFGAPREWARTLAGALLVGVGSVLAMGCTVGHGLSGIAVLALGSFVGLAAILAGAWTALRLEARLGQRMTGCSGETSGSAQDCPRPENG